ncbi:MAG: hypothetical protein RLZZ443_360 [Actinomycetota bacterium]|jgi:glutaredoxin
MAEVVYYGADWCSDCRRAKAVFAAEGVEFEERNVEHSVEFTAEAEAISGRKNIPVIQFADGAFLVEPSDEALRTALRERNLLG